MNHQMNDYEYMRLAISLAQATLGQTSPNPSVGAVLVKNGQLIGTGTHLQSGSPHAEVHAIHSAGDNAKGAVLYVTLEPCSHHGQTPPCTESIIKAAIKKVFVASLDPNPLVAGKGIEQLRLAGIEVEIGLCKEEARKMNEMYFHYIQTNTPFVTIKAAISLDGKIATRTGDSKWITSNESRQDVHNLRHIHDGILVGIQTIIKDNPLLTTRRPLGGRNPIRIILDTELKIPMSAHVIQDQSAKTMIFTGNKINQLKKEELQHLGVTVISQNSSTISIKQVLKTLADYKITSILVEGGSAVHASFMEEEAFQQIITYMAPKIIGGKNAIPYVGGIGLERVQFANGLQFTDIQTIGPDIKITAVPLKKEGIPCSQELSKN